MNHSRPEALVGAEIAELKTRAFSRRAGLVRPRNAGRASRGVWSASGSAALSVPAGSAGHSSSRFASRGRCSGWRTARPRVAACSAWTLRLALPAFLLLAGCATPRPDAARALARPREDQVVAFARAQQTLSHAFPPAYRATHRAVITVGKRQYVCDGFLTAGPEDGLHLALVSSLGLVAEVRRRTNASAEVVKVTPLFRESWSRDHVLRDLRWLFAPPGELHPAGSLADGRLALEPTAGASGLRARYLFSSDGQRWEGLELWEKGRRAYHAILGGHRRDEGWPPDLPADIRVDAGTYRLHLRVVELKIGPPTNAAGTAAEVTP